MAKSGSSLKVLPGRCFQVATGVLKPVAGFRKVVLAGGKSKSLSI